MSKIYALLLVLLVSFFSACDLSILTALDEDESDVTGVWEVVSTTEDGETVQYPIEEEGVEERMYIKIDSVLRAIFYTKQDDETNIYYCSDYDEQIESISDGTIVTDEGTSTYELDGDILIVTDPDGDEYEMKRSSSSKISDAVDICNGDTGDGEEDGIDGVVWESSIDTAVEKAKANNRLVLLFAGRDTCGNCRYMKDTVFEDSSVKEELGDDYVIAKIDVDTDNSYYPYASGLSGFTLPLIAIIDPDNSGTYYNRSTGVVYPSEFVNFLKEGSDNLL